MSALKETRLNELILNYSNGNKLSIYPSLFTLYIENEILEQDVYCLKPTGETFVSMVSQTVQVTEDTMDKILPQMIKDIINTSWLKVGSSKTIISKSLKYIAIEMYPLESPDFLFDFQNIVQTPEYNIFLPNNGQINKLNCRFLYLENLYNKQLEQKGLSLRLRGFNLYLDSIKTYKDNFHQAFTRLIPIHNL